MIKFHIFQPKNYIIFLKLNLRRQPVKRINLRPNESKMDQRGSKLNEWTKWTKLDGMGPK